ncbi:alpha/beta hydrolase [Ectobacillus sp. SYSU M60031]|uniref:Alpha/beta hydrolase n=1 Tax=Ectobacillus ponti TaxID=2961894 RepID=A0AA42BU18_9BACI|nr:alpha/beta hydrolase [Ectobacillus ponti]
MVGVSMGGVVAQMLAYSYPGYVKSLVLADTWCEMPDQTSKLVMALTVLLTKLLPVQFINSATYSLYKGKQPDQVYTREILSKSLKFTKKTFLVMKTTPLPKIKEHLHRIAADTLVMYGDRKSYGIDEERGAACAGWRFL